MAEKQGTRPSFNTLPCILHSLDHMTLGWIINYISPILVSFPAFLEKSLSVFLLIVSGLGIYLCSSENRKRDNVRGIAIFYLASTEI